MKALAYKEATGLTVTYPKTELKYHETNLGEMCSQHVSSSCRCWLSSPYSRGTNLGSLRERQWFCHCAILTDNNRNNNNNNNNNFCNLSNMSCYSLLLQWTVACVRFTKETDHRLWMTILVRWYDYNVIMCLWPNIMPYQKVIGIECHVLTQIMERRESTVTNFSLL